VACTCERYNVRKWGSALAHLRIERCLGTSGVAISATEEGTQQKQVVPVFAPDLLSSCQPGQDAHGTTPSLGRKMCSAQVAPSIQIL
jgi:hypothetical protein